MEVFVYNAAKPRESMDDFNRRVADFCLDNAVVSVNAQTCGPQLVLSITLADDIEAVEGPTLMPWTMQVDQNDATLEETLTEAVSQLRALHSDEEARVPAEVHIQMREDRPDQGYAVFFLITGSIEVQE